MPLQKSDITIGMQVQDADGNAGIVRWLGKLDKHAKPPGAPGTYAAVEFEPTSSPDRTDGTWAGKRYCQAPPGSVLFVKPKRLEKERNTEGIRAVRSQLGDRVADWSDRLIVKFLIARMYDIPKTLEMITNHLQWRETFRPSSDEYFPPEMAKDYPVGFGDGTDADGCLLYFERPCNGGACDGNEFVKKYGIPRIARWHACIMEEGLRHLQENPSAQRVTMVVDLSGFTAMDRQVMNFARSIAKIDQDNYPEYLHKLFIINAPTIFAGAWRLVRMFVDDRTKAKVHVLGKDYAETVQQHINPKYWPSFMGGNNDSWLRKGGMVGTDDPSKARDPESGYAVADDDTITDEQIMSASNAAPSPTATPTARESASSASENDEALHHGEVLG